MVFYNNYRGFFIKSPKTSKKLIQSCRFRENERYMKKIPPRKHSFLHLTPQSIICHKSLVFSEGTEIWVKSSTQNNLPIFFRHVLMRTYFLILALQSHAKLLYHKLE